jgi:dCTP deaminase
MSFWSGEKLLANSSVIVPFSHEQIDCNAYTLRMGNCYYRTAEQETGHQQKKTFLSDGESFLIPAGQFAYLLSKESVQIPDHAMAFISMKTRVKFQGLINVSGFHVDPGYKGKLIYAVYNASPSSIQICENDPIFKIWFCDLDRSSTSPYVFGKPGLTDIDNDLIKGMSKEILSLQSLADKIRASEASINAKFAEQKPIIDYLNFIWRAIIIGIVVAFLVGLLPFIAQFGQQAGQRAARIPPPEQPATVPPPAPPRPR